MRIALATCDQFPDLDEDDALLVGALTDLGLHPEPAVWDDQRVRWAEFDAVVVRQTWDYAERIDEFLAWAETTSINSLLLNPVPVIRWSTDKHYLNDLTRAGVACVPTTFYEPGGADHIEFPSSEEFVVKPSISAGSRNTARYAHADHREATAHVHRLLGEGRSVMVQPYLSRVDTTAETALLFFGGEFSHAARKGPLLTREGAQRLAGGLFLEETIDPRAATAEQIAVARRALGTATECTGAAPTYARVDLLDDDHGSPVVLELELVEPSAFLRTDAGAAHRFAGAIRAQLDGHR